MKSLLIRPILLPAVRWWLRLLQTERPRVHPLEKIVRVILHLPAMGLLVAALRLRLALFGPIEVSSESREGGTFRSMLPDLIQMYIHLFGIWEPDLTAFISSRLRPGDTFIDVGANIGWFTMLAAKRSARVVAIEPLPSIHAELDANVQRNGMQDRVRLVMAAASDRVEVVHIHSGPAWNLGKSSMSQRRELGKPGEVAAAPVSDLLLPEEVAQVRLIKIDVEGAEDVVLRGLMALLPRLRADAEILVELSPAWWSTADQSPGQVLQPYFEAGFHAYEISNIYWPWRYLWPNDVGRVHRVRKALDRHARRLDIVLSRTDEDELLVIAHA